MNRVCQRTQDGSYSSLAPTADVGHSCPLSHSLHQCPVAYTAIHMTFAHTSAQTEQALVFAVAAHGSNCCGGGALLLPAVVLRLPGAITCPGRRNIPRSAARGSLCCEGRQLVALRSGAKRSIWPAGSQRQAALTLTPRTPQSRPQCCYADNSQTQKIARTGTKPSL